MRMRASVILLLSAATLASVKGFFVVPNQKTRDLGNRFKIEMGASLKEQNTSPMNRPMDTASSLLKGLERVTFSALLVAVLSIGSPLAAHAGEGGANVGSNAKITTGGASTLQSGRTITITRGVNLDRSNFEGQNLKGVAFQQSIVRDTNFKNCNLVGSSFFDATIDGSDFTNADMTLSNVEMAQFKRANLHNTIMKEVYVSGATLFEGIKDIEGSDWTDTYRK